MKDSRLFSKKKKKKFDLINEIGEMEGRGEDCVLIFKKKKISGVGEFMVGRKEAFWGEVLEKESLGTGFYEWSVDGSVKFSSFQVWFSEL